MSDPGGGERKSHALQMIGSLLAATLIVLLTVALVTAKLGPGVETREREEEQEELIEQEEELRDEREERRDAVRERLQERREELVELRKDVADRVDGAAGGDGPLTRREERLLDQIREIQARILDRRERWKGSGSG